MTRVLTAFLAILICISCGKGDKVQAFQDRYLDLIARVHASMEKSILDLTQAKNNQEILAALHESKDLLSHIDRELSSLFIQANLSDQQVVFILNGTGEKRNGVLEKINEFIKIKSVNALKYFDIQSGEDTPDLESILQAAGELDGVLESLKKSILFQ